jgi:hypothetical protein
MCGIGGILFSTDGEDGLWNARQWVFNGRVFVRTLYKTGVRPFRAKCRAIARYTSEWPVLFGADEQHIREMLNDPMNTDPYWDCQWPVWEFGSGSVIN